MYGDTYCRIPRHPEVTDADGEAKFAWKDGRKKEMMVVSLLLGAKKCQKDDKNCIALYLLSLDHDFRDHVITSWDINE